ncbi:MAG: serine hydrolase [Desulfobacula sp.]|jgi:CubicO group peptidase (beta-lactamase class C family)|uniref:serine hydrolase domain-containing protein n=1 Tax=Desulfobacula sp. TaxID=2593537 RepID=UPI001DC17673|nr:serine hydrolase [Desulfobacula sp.]MBT3807437.1 serine hydrolase [Desulfobacula sp.]MBT4026437.1 serine hydrolase [Desulfobacula sp.]MBT4201257.1 serine hydrolase [Desulfobacula sp.]MBT4505240.1 serine hydrolase [Desulfobacula sp.]
MKQIIQCLLIFVLVNGMSWNIGLAAEKLPDYWPTSSWKTASPESQGVDSELLVKMLDTIWKNDINIDSVLVIRNGYILLDVYNYPFDSSTRHNIYSCTKSISSALIGIAIDKGYIKNINQPIINFFPKYATENLNDDKKAITLKHLLTMTSGLYCRDSYLYRWSGLMQMRFSKDWVKFMIDLPMAEEPGTRFEYCNGVSFLLSAILQEQTHENALSFAEKNLFGPMGITNVRWPSNPQGITLGYSQLQMLPRDMAKFGFLYLNNGVWDGQQIISSQWIKESTSKHIDATLAPGYGYQWWIVNPDIYTAIGHQGQFIMVVPKKNLVAVFTSSLAEEDFYTPLGLLTAYIVPAVKSSTSLVENPDKANEIKSYSNLLQTTNHFNRRKMNKKTRETSQELKFETYVNNEYGFSIKYDADLLDMDSQPVSPFIFRRRGLKGLPVLAALVDDIPQGMALENTADYMINLYKSTLKITDYKIKKQTRSRLLDGTQVNYFELTWKYQALELLTAGVFTYKNNKIIGAVAGSTQETPIDYLAGMVKSLKFKK